jgi:NADPH:quinone reductase-like Zn-dependent oxidoreductase
MIGFTTMGHMLATLFKKAVSKFPLIQFTAEVNVEDLHTLAVLVEKGKLKPQIEKIFSYKEIPKAIGYIEAMRTRGKVAMMWRDDQNQSELLNNLT